MKNRIFSFYTLNTFSSKKNLLVVAFILLQSVTLFGQTKKAATLYAKPYRDSIALRWQIYDAKLWQTNITRGYDIYRRGQNGQIQKLNDSTIKALPPHPFALRYTDYPAPLDTSGINEQNEDRYSTPPNFETNFQPDSAALKAMILQFSEEVGFNFQMPSRDGNFDFGDDPLAIRWLFHSITCLSSKEAAIVSGLFFVDKKVNPNERYTYYVTSAGDGINKALASVTISASDPYPVKQPKGMKDNTNRRRSVLTWKKADTSMVYLPTYEIYRSESKNGQYIRLNKDPLLAVYTGVLDSTIVSFNDSTLQKGKTYYYKVRGKDLFGDYTPYSEPYVVTEKTFIEYAPYIEEARKNSNNPVTCRIQWKVDAKEEENIASFKLYRSNQSDTLFKPLSETLKKDQRYFIDKSPTKNNYYKLLTVGNAGDSLWSSPSYVLIADSIPPAPAVMLTAVCDSSGIVTLTWKHNDEPDLHSFKLFRANYQHEEFSRIATINMVDTIYKDTVSLQTLTESIYYKIIAYDDSYNPSNFSNVIKAKRYDIIPPTHPVFTDLRSDSAGIRLTWGNSSSEDVIKTILYRKLKDETSWHEYKAFARDTTKYTTFTDTSLFRGMWYEYALESFDDDKLRSGFSPAVQLKALDNGFRPEIKDIKSKSDVRKGIVKLSWNYKYPGVELFQIYRAEGDKKATILASVPFPTSEFYDKEVGSGNRYRYRVRAVFKDGGESPFSKEIIVQF